MTGGLTPAPAVPLIRVCAWHTPQPELDALNRQFPGRVTHGMCAACKTQFEQEIA
jgi:hypothetical protein